MQTLEVPHTTVKINDSVYAFYAYQQDIGKDRFLITELDHNGFRIGAETIAIWHEPSKTVFYDGGLNIRKSDALELTMKFTEIMKQRLSNNKK